VTDANGALLDQNDIVRTRVIGQDVASLVTTCLEGVIASGTGTAAAIDRPAAGKTGTTSNYRDAWFVGYTPDLVTAVWVGYPDEQKAMTDVHGIKVTGGSFPAKIWAAFMRQAVKGTPVSRFPQSIPDGWVEVQVCGESHQLPTPFCPSTIKMLFRADEVPTQQCQLHQPHEAQVPDLIGSPKEQAEAALKQAGFNVAVVEDPSSTQPKGTVVDQTPAGGSTLLQGKTVTLVVSSGSAQTQTTVSMPDVQGKDIAEATKELARLGLLVHEAARPDPSPTGTVLSQDIAPGTAVTPGTAVNLTTSAGQESSSTTTTVR
jgi:membrane peptidoglycan carboxypeptidase